MPLTGQIGIGRSPGIEPLLPIGFGLGAALHGGAEMGQGFVRKIELLVRIPAEILLGRLHFFCAEWRAVGLAAARLVGRAEADGGANHDERRSRRLGLGCDQGAVDGFDVGVAMFDAQDLPTIRFEALAHVFGERQRGGAVERHLVVVVEPDQLAQSEMARERSRFVGDAFHHVAVAHQGVGRVIDDGVAGLVVATSEKAFGHGHADCVAGALPERAGGGLHARGEKRFRVAGRARAPLAEGLDVIQGQVVPGQVKQRIEQHGSVPSREHEAVAIRPLGVARIVLEVPLPQHIGHGRSPHGQARVARIGLLHGIDRKDANGIDGEVAELVHALAPVLARGGRNW